MKISEIPSTKSIANIRESFTGWATFGLKYYYIELGVIKRIVNGSEDNYYKTEWVLHRYEGPAFIEYTKDLIWTGSDFVKDPAADTIEQRFYVNGHLVSEVYFNMLSEVIKAKARRNVVKNMDKLFGQKGSTDE